MFELKQEVELKDFITEAERHEEVADASAIDAKDAGQMLEVGIETDSSAKYGTFIQKDSSVIHCKTKQEGVEVTSIGNALEKHSWVSDYLWKNVSPDADEFTAYAKEKPQGGYFIRALPGVKTKEPVQSCLYLAKENFAQNVHNLVIAEEGSQLHIITGCATSPHVNRGLHVGVSEFFIKKGATVMFTMIHDWGEEISVRPKTGMVVEEGGTIISNYISLKPVGNLKMYPTTRLVGRGAVARLNSVLVAGKGSMLDVGSRVVLEAPETKAEIISRAITVGGTIIARGDLVGMVPGVKAHLECKGLILKEGLMHAIPELSGYVPGVEMSHEAAVGKIDRREIEYIMARGVTEEEAVSTIVRGFLNVEIEGLPPKLKARIDKAIEDTQEDML